MLKEALVSLLVLVIILCKTLRCFPACTFFSPYIESSNYFLFLSTATVFYE